MPSPRNPLDRPDARFGEILELGDGLTLRAGDGSLIAVLPGPLGLGAQVTLLPARELRRRKSRMPGRGRGRPPSEATATLRARLSSQARSGTLSPPSAYIAWYADLARVATGPAGQIVRRELRRARGTASQRRA